MMASYPTSVWAGHTAPATLAGPPTHEDMHEDVSDEIVAMQTELGTNPSGSAASVATLLGGFAVRGGSATPTTDASGDVSVTFGTTFAAAPNVVAVNGDESAAQFTVHINSISTTGFSIRCRELTNGDPVPASNVVRINWVAVGTL